MTLELVERERAMLDALLDTAYKEKLHELHHAARSDYKQLLRQQLDTIEELRTKLSGVAVAG